MNKLCPDTALIFLCDFETTGFVEEEGSEVIEVAFLLLNNRLDILDQYESLVIPPSKKGLGNDWRWSGREQKAFEDSHRISPQKLRSEGSPSDYVTGQINHLLFSYQASRIELMSDNAYFDFSFAKKLGLKNLHFNAIDAKTMLRMAGVERPTKITKKHRAMNDVLNLYRSIVIAWDRLSKRGV